MSKKHLILIPTTLLTALLVVVFMAPGAAQGALRAVPGLHLHVGGLATDLVAAQQDSTSAGSSGSSLTSSPDGASSGSASPSVGSPTVDALTLQIMVDGVHSVSTASQENCGRFGNGFHGGKHLFTCPNRPFPPPANH